MNRNLATIIINTLLIATATLTVIPLLWMISAFMPAMVSPLPSHSVAGRWARDAARYSYEFVRRMQMWMWAAKGAACPE
jgi:hypothetical protein